MPGTPAVIVHPPDLTLSQSAIIIDFRRSAVFVKRARSFRNFSTFWRYRSACAALSGFWDAVQSRISWSICSSVSNIAATISPASRRWKERIWSAAAPKASCGISKPRLLAEPLAGHTGIGHTRWATHGKPTENNAHPHATERVAVVHNGIIENFRDLRNSSRKRARILQTETDTEVVLIWSMLYSPTGCHPVEAVKATLSQLRGAFALGFIFAGDDDL